MLPSVPILLFVSIAAVTLAFAWRAPEDSSKEPLFVPPVYYSPSPPVVRSGEEDVDKGLDTADVSRRVDDIADYVAAEEADDKTKMTASYDLTSRGEVSVRRRRRNKDDVLHYPVTALVDGRRSPFIQFLSERIGHITMKFSVRPPVPMTAEDCNDIFPEAATASSRSLLLHSSIQCQAVTHTAAEMRGGLVLAFGAHLPSHFFHHHGMDLRFSAGVLGVRTPVAALSVDPHMSSSSSITEPGFCGGQDDGHVSVSTPHICWKVKFCSGRRTACRQIDAGCIPLLPSAMAPRIESSFDSDESTTAVWLRVLTAGGDSSSSGEVRSVYANVKLPPLWHHRPKGTQTIILTEWLMKPLCLPSVGGGQPADGRALLAGKSGQTVKTRSADIIDPPRIHTVGGISRGCLQRECNGRGVCVAYILDDSSVYYKCTCGRGFTGDTCESIKEQKESDGLAVWQVVSNFAAVGVLVYAAAFGYFAFLSRRPFVKRKMKCSDSDYEDDVDNNLIPTHNPHDRFQSATAAHYHTSSDNDCDTGGGGPQGLYGTAAAAAAVRRQSYCAAVGGAGWTNRRILLVLLVLSLVVLLGGVSSAIYHLCDTSVYCLTINNAAVYRSLVAAPSEYFPTWSDTYFYSETTAAARVYKKSSNSTFFSPRRYGNEFDAASHFISEFHAAPNPTLNSGPAAVANQITAADIGTLFPWWGTLSQTTWTGQRRRLVFGWLQMIDFALGYVSMAFTTIILAGIEFYSSLVLFALSSFTLIAACLWCSVVAPLTQLLCLVVVFAPLVFTMGYRMLPKYDQLLLPPSSSGRRRRTDSDAESPTATPTAPRKDQRRRWAHPTAIGLGVLSFAASLVMWALGARGTLDYELAHGTWHVLVFCCPLLFCFGVFGLP